MAASSQLQDKSSCLRCFHPANPFLPYTKQIIMGHSPSGLMTNAELEFPYDHTEAHFGTGVLRGAAVEQIGAGVN